MMPCSMVCIHLQAWQKHVLTGDIAIAYLPSSISPGPLHASTRDRCSHCSCDHRVAGGSSGREESLSSSARDTKGSARAAASRRSSACTGCVWVGGCKRGCR